MYYYERFNRKDFLFYPFTVSMLINNLPMDANYMIYGESIRSERFHKPTNHGNYIRKLRSGLFNTNKDGYMCNTSFSQSTRQFYVMAGETIDGMKAYLDDINSVLLDCNLVDNKW